MRAVIIERVIENLDKQIREEEKIFWEARKELSSHAPYYYMRHATLKAAREWLLAQETVEYNDRAESEWVYYDDPHGTGKLEAYHFDGTIGFAVCKRCGASAGLDSDNFSVISKFCPHCGSIMKGA